mmetsp:Transcript_8027/g.18717  ORF Transcript_8027/g.18717 Transcript_8027/m.18717 type:complete len:83 (+) Transcript_8027:372-620(+)
MTGPMPLHTAWYPEHGRVAPNIGSLSGKMMCGLSMGFGQPCRFDAHVAWMLFVSRHGLHESLLRALQVALYQKAQAGRQHMT